MFLMLGFLLARRRNSRDPEAGFSLLEMVVAISVIFGALLVLLSTALVGLSDAALARQRHSANAIANQVLEQIRALPYERVIQGLETADIATDPNIITCLDGKKYFKGPVCGDPTLEPILHTAGLPALTPLVPNKGSVGPPSYPNTFTWRSYVTKAVGVPTAGAFRVTSIVSWTPTVRAGAALPVRAQTLIYKPEGSTDPTTGSGAFFYGTTDLVRGSMKLTPNAGVSGGTGVTGLGAWDSIAQELSGAGTDLTTQALSRSDGQVTLDGATKVVGGVETESGGTNSLAKADDDSVTAFPTSSSPSAISSTAAAVTLSGGSNTITAGGIAPGGQTCPAAQPAIRWMTGFEHGRTSTPMGGTSGLFEFSGGALTVDSTVKRSGNYSAKMAPAGASTYGQWLYEFASTRKLIVHFAFRLASLPTSDVSELASAKNVTANSYAMFFGYQQSSNRFTLRLRNGSGALTAPVTSSVNVVAGQWYAMDLYWDTAGTTHTGSWQIDGAPQTNATLTGAAATDLYTFALGSTVAATFTANYDDILASVTAADYPIPDGAVKQLVPNGMGTSNVGTTIKNESGGTADLASWWQKVDDIPASGATDYIQQTANNSGHYAEFTFQDTADTCIRGVQAITFHRADGGNKTNNGGVHVINGANDFTAWAFNLGPNLAAAGYLVGVGEIIPPVTSPWTQAQVNGLKMRVGYSTDTSPIARWDVLTLQYYVPAGAAITPSDQSGFGRATVPPSSPNTCYASQTAGACSYAQAAYPAGPPKRETTIDLAGSGAGRCLLYEVTPDVATSYTYGRRDFSASPTGSIVGDVVHHYGVHQIGGLCDVTVTPPAGWPGYLVKYDPGGAANSVKAAAGVQATYPRFTSGGTISYWNGTGVSTMAPPAAGGDIPVADFVGYISNGWRYDITVTLATLPSSVTQTPVGAPMSGIADRSEAKAVLGSPIAGKITYKLTNTGTGNVVVDLTIDVDLGSLTASSVYTV